jgi:hypothetical protein
MRERNDGEKSPEEIKLGLVSKLEKFLSYPCASYGGEILHSVKDGQPQPSNKRKKGWSTSVLAAINNAIGIRLISMDFRPRAKKLINSIAQSELVEDWMIDETEKIAREVIEKLKNPK